MADTTAPKSDVDSLPGETLDFASKMFDAARDGNSELILAAVDAGLPPNLTNAKGNTLLMLAAYAGHKDISEALLKKGADPNRLNDLGQSIIAGAVFKGYDEVVKLLAANGADPRSGTPTAIQTAHMFNRKELFEVLGTKEGDADVEVPRPPSALVP